MIYATTSQSFEAVAQGFTTGLAGTIGVRVRDEQGGDALARTTVGIVEDIAGSGIYRVSLTAPSAVGSYLIVWDDGSGRYATEDLLVSYQTVAPSGSGNLYISVAALKATLNLSSETYADADILSAITAASAGLDGACNRRFWKDGQDATRYYTPFSRHMIVIDDLADFTSLAIDMNGDGIFETTLTENTDFVFEPFNAETDGRPREVIRILHRSGKWLPDPDYYPRSAQVVGKFGWDAVPANIVQAATVLASKLLRRSREAPFGIVAMGGLDSAAVIRIARTDPDVAFLIGDLIRKPTPA